MTACKGGPMMKYPALCAALGGTGIACYVTGGNPLTVYSMITLAESIVKE